MDIRPLHDRYAVTPQITPEDIAEIAAAGFDTVICNRPDRENPEHLHAASLRPLVEAAGMTFVENPVTGGALTMENVERQRAVIDDESRGKVLAYCASGNRSATVWALALAGRQPTDALIAAPARHGYQLEPIRALIERLAQEG